MLKFRFNLRTTIICLFLSCCFFRLSYWQYSRYHQKLDLIKELQARLYQEEIDFESLAKTLPSPDNAELWQALLHRRVKLNGEYDFEHEIIIKNRRFQGVAGSLVITPLKINYVSADLKVPQIPAGRFPEYILVNRGFIPFETARSETRKIYRHNKLEELEGFIKESLPRKFLAPEDKPAGGGNPWVDEWLRVDIDNLQKQLPYKVFPVYVEKIAPGTNPQLLAENLINKSSEKKEMLSMVNRNAVPKLEVSEKDLPFPFPDTYVSPGRHFEYIWEWAIMGIGALVIGGVLQLKR